MTDAPTVPRPAMPTRKGRVTNESSLGKSACVYESAVRMSMRRQSRPLHSPDQRHHVVQGCVRGVEELADIAGCLPYPLLVFHKGDAHVIVAEFAKADAGRHGHIG